MEKIIIKKEKNREKMKKSKQNTVWSRKIYKAGNKNEIKRIKKNKKLIKKI